MEREEDKRLKELRDAGAEIYSISRLNTMNQCPYQAYLNYVKNIKGSDNVWALLGGYLHDALQKCIDTGCSEDIVLDSIQKELDNLDIIGIDFPKDKNGGTVIRENWIANMTRFAKEFKTPVGNFETERLILFKVRDGVYMQGYIDLIRHNEDGTIWIIDWKTSSEFKGEHLKEAGRQLCLYAMAKEAEGYTVSKVSWCMLKYVDVSWQDKKGNTKHKISEWRKFGADMKSTVKKFLEDEGYDEMEVESYLYNMIVNNSFDQLPDVVKNRFTRMLYVQDYELTDEVREECLQYINDTIDKYQTYGEDENNYQPCDIAKEPFFCASLCSFGACGACKYYNEYREGFSQSKDDDDLF